MDRWEDKRRAVYSALRRQERFAGKRTWSPVVKGNLPSKKTKGVLGTPGGGDCMCRGTVALGNVAHIQGTPRSPSVHADRQGMPWVKALSLQGLGGPIGELGLHPKEEQRLLKMYRYSMARLAFQRENSGSSFHSSQ